MTPVEFAKVLRGCANAVEQDAHSAEAERLLCAIDDAVHEWRKFGFDNKAVDERITAMLRKRGVPTPATSDHE